MKYLYLLLAVVISYSSSAQEAPLFENTWHLRTVQSDGSPILYDVAEMNPPIAPYLSISEDLSFNGEGACNIFNGTFSFHPPNILNTTEFSATLLDCDVEEQNHFENSYFAVISSEFDYEISHDGEGAVLTLVTSMGGEAVFTSHSLSTNDLINNGLSLYPNPVNDMLNIELDRELNNSTVQILTMEGKVLIFQKARFGSTTSINVSNLSNGVYFLKLEDKYGKKTIKKFIKSRY